MSAICTAPCALVSVGGLDSASIRCLRVNNLQCERVKAAWVTAMSALDARVWQVAALLELNDLFHSTPLTSEQTRDSRYHTISQHCTGLLLLLLGCVLPTMGCVLPTTVVHTCAAAMSQHMSSQPCLCVYAACMQVLEAFHALRQHGVDVVTLGQYMRPTKRHMAVEEFVTPAAFEAYQQAAEQMGFLYVASGPLVRSSYRAGEFYLKNVLQARRAEGSQEQVAAVA